MSIGDWVSAPFNQFDSFMHPERGYEDAMKKMQRSWQQAQNYQRPYWEAGNAELPWLNNMRDQLSNPGQLENDWAKGYEMSPYAKDLMDRSLSAGRDEASSMGLNGSSAALENSQRTAGSITSQDRQQYMNDMMQKFLASIGIGQNIYGIGAQTGANLGNQAMNYGEQQGGLDFGRRSSPGMRFQQIMGAVTPFIGQAMGGGMEGSPGAGMSRSPGTGVF